MAAAQTMSERKAPLPESGSERGTSGRSKRVLGGPRILRCHLPLSPSGLRESFWDYIYTGLPSKTTVACDLEYTSCLSASTIAVRLVAFVPKYPREMCQELLCINTRFKVSPRGYRDAEKVRAPSAVWTLKQPESLVNYVIINIMRWIY